MKLTLDLLLQRFVIVVTDVNIDIYTKYFYKIDVLVKIQNTKLI